MSLPRTRHSLRRAEEDREIARRLLDAADLPAARYRWSVIAAFYSAVHYLNAYLQHAMGMRPRDHTERMQFVRRLHDLQPLRASYARLQGRGWDARYRDDLQVPSEEARQFVEDDLEQVRRVVLELLEPPTT